MAFSIIFASPLPGSLSAETQHIDLTVSGLKRTYAPGEPIVFSVNAEGVSGNSCNIGTPSVWIRNDGNGEAIYWPRPFGFSTAIMCAAPEPVDRDWTFGDEIIPDAAGQYSVVVSLEDIRLEKKFSVE